MYFVYFNTFQNRQVSICKQFNFAFEYVNFTRVDYGLMENIFANGSQKLFVINYNFKISIKFNKNSLFIHYVYSRSVVKKEYKNRITRLFL